MMARIPMTTTNISRTGIFRFPAGDGGAIVFPPAILRRTSKFLANLSGSSSKHLATTISASPSRLTSGPRARAQRDRHRLNRPFLTGAVQGVQIAHHGLHPLAQDVSVDLGGRNIGVAQKLLDGTQIGAVVQQMARKGMPQHMRADPRRRDPRCGGA